MPVPLSLPLSHRVAESKRRLVAGCLLAIAVMCAAPATVLGQSSALFTEPGTHAWTPPTPGPDQRLAISYTVVGGGGGGGGGQQGGGGGGGAGALGHTTFDLGPPGAVAGCFAVVGAGGAGGGRGNTHPPFALGFIPNALAQRGGTGQPGGESRIGCLWSNGRETRFAIAGGWGGPGAFGNGHGPANLHNGGVAGGIAAPGGHTAVPNRCTTAGHVLAGQFGTSERSLGVPGGAGGKRDDDLVPEAGDGGDGGSGRCFNVGHTGVSPGSPGEDGYVRFRAFLIDVPPADDSDEDEDGVAYRDDNCPDDANPTQIDRDRDGVGDACDPHTLIDTDNDGIEDEFDNCPRWPGGGLDTDGDGRGDDCDADLDGDGVDNDADSCPSESNPGAAQTDDLDGDGRPDACDADRDGDTVDDASDNCPNAANAGQEDEDGDGEGDACDDMHAPTTTDDVDAARWHRSPVTVTLTAEDDRTGVAATYHRIDGGTVTASEHPVPADPLLPVEATLTVPAAGNDGEHLLEYRSVDRAGNQEDIRSTTIRIDSSAPSIEADRTPANANGWNDGDVEVRFSCADQEGLSGIATCEQPQRLTSEGAAQSVTGTATDRAGNETSTTVSGINIDRTSPGIAFTGHEPEYDIDESISIDCVADDALSGLETQTCEDADVAAAELGEGTYTLRGEATDRAGNTTSKQVTFRIVASARGLLRLARREVEDLSSPRRQTRDRLRSVVRSLDRALASPAWAGDSQLTGRDADDVLDRLEDIAEDLERLARDRRSGLDRAAIRLSASRLSAAAGLVTARAIADARAAGGRRTSLDRAERDAAKGEAAAARGRYADAMALFGDAFESAIREVRRR